MMTNMCFLRIQNGLKNEVGGIKKGNAKEHSES